MKRLIAILAAGAMTALLYGCTTAMLAAGTYYDDDLYAVGRNRTVIVSSPTTTVTPARTASSAPAASYGLDAEIDDILGSVDPEAALNDDLLVTDYSTALNKRLDGRASLTYGSGASYTNYLASDDYYATLRYDPSYYNVMVVGDNIWVEPKYISSLFIGMGIAAPIIYNGFSSWMYPFYRTSWLIDDLIWGGFGFYRPWYTWDSYWWGPSWSYRHSWWAYDFGPYYYYHPHIGHHGWDYRRPGVADRRRGIYATDLGRSGMRPAGGRRTGGSSATYRRDGGAIGGGRAISGAGDRGNTSFTPGRSGGEGGRIGTPANVNGEGRTAPSGGGSNMRTGGSYRRGSASPEGSMSAPARSSASPERRSSVGSASSAASSRRSSSSGSGFSGFSSGSAGSGRSSGGFSGGFSGGSHSSGGYSGGGGGASRRR